MNRLYTMFLLLLISNFPASVLPDDKPTLTLSFKIAQGDYCQRFPGDTLLIIEKTCMKGITDLLNSYFGFLRFTEDRSPDSLLITLDDGQEPTAFAKMPEVGFWITVRGPHISGRIQEVYWIFRPWENYDLPLGSQAALINEVLEKLGNRFRKEDHEMVERLFSKIQLADTALPIREELTWVLPFTRKVLCVDDDSQFWIENEFRDSLGTSRRRYTTLANGDYDPVDIDPLNRYCLGIKTEAIREQQYLDKVRGNTPMDVKGVYIYQYFPYREEIRTVSPDELHLIPK